VEERPLDATHPDLAGWANPAVRLRDALAKNEFTLYCQPILAVAEPSKFPMGEVLVRLREEESALLPPGEFLPVFEHYRMMPQLDRWVLHHLIRRLAQGTRIARFSMNVSWQTLEDAEFPKFFAGETKSAGLAPGSVLFELDEPDVLNRAPLVERFAAAIKAAGGGVVIDGFGRKAVSFTPLKALKPDFVKVDGSIVRKLEKSEVARTKMTAMVTVGRSLGSGIIAECVEEKEILERLKVMGVRYAQGFGIVQPQPIDSLSTKKA
jgi:EAL domain-containing protein (putative c-di-GMP-specific phosphodiesterase class I)